MKGDVIRVTSFGDFNIICDDYGHELSLEKEYRREHSFELVLNKEEATRFARILNRWVRTGELKDVDLSEDH